MKYDMLLGIEVLLYGLMDRILNFSDKDGNPISIPFKTKYAFEKNMEKMKRDVAFYDQSSTWLLALHGDLNEETEQVELITEGARKKYEEGLANVSSTPVAVELYKVPLIEFNRLMDLEVFNSLEEVNLFHIYLTDDNEFLANVRGNIEEKKKAFEEAVNFPGDVELMIEPEKKKRTRKKKSDSAEKIE